MEKDLVNLSQLKKTAARTNGLIGKVASSAADAIEELDEMIQNTPAVDYTLQKVDGVLGVSVPNKPITREEFNSLTNEEKAGKVWIVDEAPWTPTTISVQDYDTDDGWHVRKYSDGYVEMSRHDEAIISSDNFVAWGSIFIVDGLYKQRPLPVSMTEKYHDFLSVAERTAGYGYNGYGLIPITGGVYNELTYMPSISLARATKLTSEHTYSIYYSVTGRWK